ncbi:NAD(P)/FAD-dependent oxidoreductase [Spirosoma pulveris]
MNRTQMRYDADVIIVGGGLAGLIAGIDLARSGVQVLLLEKYNYPQHKVCGEYISNEVLPYLQHLGVCIDELNPSRISRFLLSTAAGKTVESTLPLGGFGVSRYTLDQFLAHKAQSAGVDLRQADVTDIQFYGDVFTVTTADEITYRSPIVLGAYGKRSQLDKRLNRPFATQESNWLGVKAHYKADFPNDLVALHNFDGGYCGLSQVENGIVNACYLANYRSFKAFKHIDSFQQHVLRRNPFLDDFFAKATPLFTRPLTISQISFDRKSPVENHILMCGDTAGLIHPLCGNGMAMAIHSAKLVSELVIQFFNGKLANRSALEKQYTNSWSSEFKTRLLTGRIAQTVLSYPAITDVLLTSLQRTPGVLPILIKQTHGKPLLV